MQTAAATSTVLSLLNSLSKYESQFQWRYAESVEDSNKFLEVSFMQMIVKHLNDDFCAHSQQLQ